MKSRYVVAAVIGCTIFAVVFVYGFRHTGASTERIATTLEVELLTLRPAGFEPSEIMRPKDSFVLFIDDRSGKEISSLVLQRVKGERLRTVNLNRKKSEWHDVIDLSPGTYVLQDTSNSELRCQITILP